MMQEPQRVAIPALLRQGLTAFREVQGNKQIYKVKDNWKGLTYQFEFWQFFILDVLPVCDDFTKLDSVFKDRFGHSITNEEVEELFSMVTDMKLFGPSADSHPLVSAFNKKRGIQLGGDTPGVSLQGADTKSNYSVENLSAKPEGTSSSSDTESGSKIEPDRTINVKGKPLTPGVPGAIVHNSADFTLDEFKEQNKDIRRLCQTIKDEGYEFTAIKTPENTVDWLNEILQLPDLFDKVVDRKPNLALTDEITKLKDQTEKNRKRVFKDLKLAEQNAIRKLNRLLIELTYPLETPKGTVIDDTVEEKGWNLFDPTPLLKLIQPLLLPLRYTVYLLPALIIAALFIVFRHSDLMKEDIGRFLIGVRYVHFTYLTHTLIGMLTDNLLAISLSALVAYSYRVTVKSFFIELHFGFYPRFHVLIGKTEQLTRRERIWLYAAPLLGRFGLISVSILLWFGTRAMNAPLAEFAMTIGVIAVASLYLAANPFIKSSGYNLLAAVLNEPQLRSKAALALVNKLRGNVYQKLDNNVLVAYALVSALFMVITFAVFILMFGSYVKYHFGGAGVFLTVLIILLLIYRLSEKFKQIGETYERSVQFERWKNRALPKIEDDIGKTKRKSSAITYLQVVIASLIVIGLLVPYNYEPGGNFVILPTQKQELTSELAGIISEVYFDGGEFLKKGSVIARLDCTDYVGQMKVYTAKVQEQQAVVKDLKSRPKPEEIELAKRALEVEETRAAFSKEKLKRLEKLYKDKTISFEELEDQRREHEVNLKQVREARARLQLIKAGATREEIAAAESKLQSYKEELGLYKEKIEQSVVYMPFDGRLIGINLKQKIGHYLDKGESLAFAENTDIVFAQIEVPEPDIGYVIGAAGTKVRTFTYYTNDFEGVVTLIDTIVTEKQSNQVVKVVTMIDNKDGRLKSGMTGYAKISSKTMPVWKVLSLAIIRFFKVEVWSWIP